MTNIHADELYCFYCNKHEQIFNTKFLHLPSSLPGNCSETDPEESFLERDLFVFPCPVRLLWRTINPPIPEQGSKNSIHWIKTVFHSTNESQDYSASASKNGSEILEEFPSGILGNISQFFCLSEYIYNEKWSVSGLLNIHKKFKSPNLATFRRWFSPPLRQTGELLELAVNLPNETY